jgi:hypothetical protein
MDPADLIKSLKTKAGVVRLDVRSHLVARLGIEHGGNTRWADIGPSEAVRLGEFLCEWGSKRR